MAGVKRYDTLTDEDLCRYLTQTEGEYPVRIRVSVVPLARASGRSTHVVTARAYGRDGRPIMALDTEQVLFPGATSRTIAGAAFHVASKLVQEIDTWYAQKRREEELKEPERLSPLEEYIAGTHMS